jgi:hypothetical protein
MIDASAVRKHVDDGTRMKVRGTGAGPHAGPAGPGG